MPTTKCSSIIHQCFLIFNFAILMTSAEAEATTVSNSTRNKTPPSTSSETFLTDDDFLRPLNDDETFLSAADFVNGQQLDADSTPAGKILWRQVFRKGDIRGKAAWKLDQETGENLRRNGVITGTRKWPNGRIPYVISNQYNERERAVLARSFQAYHEKTCIRFVPRTAADNDYLFIGKIDGCYSDVGRAGGRQELSLDNGCLQYDTAIHELMHSVGFYHEHERWDRDEHITILWHNIDREAYDQFGKVDLAESSYYGQLYDYYSIMHYDSLAFSKNGFETMIAKTPEMTAVIGAAIDFSPIDIHKMNLMYQCGDVQISPIDSSTQASTVAPPIVDEDDCRDRTNLCWRWIDRCNSFFFERIMKEFCPLSCGFCTPTKKSAAVSASASAAVAKASAPSYSSTILTKSSTSYLQHGR